jgi:uncharacterized protein (DUF58 family)
VREYEPPGLQALAIVLDPHPPSVEVADQIARIAASEAWDCIRDGGRVVIWAPGTEPSEAPRDLWSQLEWLARYPCPSGPSGHLRLNTEELVVVLASPDADVLEVAEAARRPRGWVVGGAEIATEIPLVRVTMEWPL